jgi:antitoxin ParD1/3/4
MASVIPPEFEQFVAQQIATGEYRSPEEVISAGLRILQALKQQQEQLRKDVQAGIDQLDRGEGIVVERDGLRAFFDDIQTRGKQRYEASRKGL